jgi:hypothetical protein
MKRERRSLWRTISISKKVNALSAPAVILYTFSISHFDDEGFMDGDARILKSQIVPLRDDIPVTIIPQLTEEISTIHEKLGVEIPLWIIHRISTEIYIEDPVFFKRQTFKGMHKTTSEIKILVDKAKQITLLGARRVQNG